MITLKTILVATDLSETSQAAFEEGRSIAAKFDAELHVLHVVADPLRETWTGFTPGPELLGVLAQSQSDARARLERMAAIGNAASPRIVIAATWGDPADEILKYARSHDIDLIVCGTHGRRGWSRVVMGSVAERIVRLAGCPVMTVNAAPDRTPAAA